MKSAASLISTEDLWSAIDALDALPETHETEWFLEASEPPHRQSLFSLVLLQGTGGELHACSATSGTG